MSASKIHSLIHLISYGGIFVFILSIHSCKKDEPCKDCSSTKIKSSFANKYFQLGFNSQLQYHLLVLDASTNQLGTSFGFCNFQNQAQTDTTDVIEASGNVMWACNDADSFLIVKTFKPVDVCQTSTPQINQLFGLPDRIWYVDTIKYKGSIYLPPCGYSPMIKFGSNNKYTLSEVVNGTTSDYSFVGADSIKLSQGPVSLYVAKTFYQRNFEGVFSAVIGIVAPFTNDITVNYKITNNRLVLTSDEGIIKLYCTN